MRETLVYKEMESPTGKLTLIANDHAIIAVLWHFEPAAGYGEPLVLDNDNALLLETEKQLNEYFNKQRKVFDIPLEFRGNDFQKKVWEAMMAIPFGKTKTYGEIARQIGDPKTVRAVGGALNKNPIPIIGPCHRIIGASGKLVGFGGGLKNKDILLHLENANGQKTLWD